VRHPVSSAMTTMVLALALTLPLGLAQVVAHVSTLTDGVDRSPTLSVFLDPTLGESDALALGSEWSSWPEVVAVDPISPEAGLAEALGYLGLSSPGDGVLENPLPWVLEVAPVEDGDLLLLVERLQALGQVSQVIVDIAWLERLDVLIDLGHRIVWVLSILLVVAFLFVIAHTIRMEVHQRRHQIEVMALVGATPAFIRRPFLYSGFWLGSISAMLAIGILTIAGSVLAGPILALGESYQLDLTSIGLGFWEGLYLIAGMGLVGVVGSILAVNQQLLGVWPKS